MRTTSSNGPVWYLMGDEFLNYQSNRKKKITASLDENCFTLKFLKQQVLKLKQRKTEKETEQIKQRKQNIMMLIDVPNFCTVLRNITDENVFYSKVSKLYQSLKILFFPSDYWDFVISRHLRSIVHFRWRKLKAILLVDASVIFQYLLFHCPLKW